MSNFSNENPPAKTSMPQPPLLSVIRQMSVEIAQRDDTIALLNKKIVEQADQIRAMQALAGKPWVPTPTVTAVSSSQPLKFTGYVSDADWRSKVQAEIDNLKTRFEAFRMYVIDAKSRGVEP